MLSSLPNKSTTPHIPPHSVVIPATQIHYSTHTRALPLPHSPPTNDVLGEDPGQYRPDEEDEKVGDARHKRRRALAPTTTAAPGAAAALGGLASGARQRLAGTAGKTGSHDGLKTTKMGENADGRNIIRETNKKKQRCSHPLQPHTSRTQLLLVSTNLVVVMG